MSRGLEPTHVIVDEAVPFELWPHHRDLIRVLVSEHVPRDAMWIVGPDPEDDEKLAVTKIDLAPPEKPA